MVCLKQMQFSAALWQPDLGQRVRRDEANGEGGNRGLKKQIDHGPSRLYFKDIPPFPRVIRVMLANRNRQRTVGARNDSAARRSHGFHGLIAISFVLSALPFQFSNGFSTQPALLNSRKHFRYVSPLDSSEKTPSSRQRYAYQILTQHPRVYTTTVSINRNIIDSPDSSGSYPSQASLSPSRHIGEHAA